MLRQWIVSQIGAREHYAVARAFEAAGSLDLLVTDYWCRRGRALLGAGPPPARALAGRWDSRVPGRKVVSFNCATLLGRLRSLGVKERPDDGRPTIVLPEPGFSASRSSSDYGRRAKKAGRYEVPSIRRTKLRRVKHWTESKPARVINLTTWCVRKLCGCASTRIEPFITRRV